MPRPIPRHRRKAGSGPPANALIAWIGTDPYLRDAAATASHRRWMALPMPSNTRSAGAAVVACSVLACGAVLGITAIISQGRATAQHTIAAPSLFGQGRPVTPGPVSPGPEPSPTLPETGSQPRVAPAPAGTAPVLAEPTSDKPTNHVEPADSPDPAHQGDPATSALPGTHRSSGEATRAAPPRTNRGVELGGRRARR